MHRMISHTSALRVSGMFWHCVVVLAKVLDRTSFGRYIHRNPLKPLRPSSIQSIQISHSPARFTIPTRSVIGRMTQS